MASTGISTTEATTTFRLPSSAAAVNTATSRVDRYRRSVGTSRQEDHQHHEEQQERLLPHRRELRGLPLGEQHQHLALGDEVQREPEELRADRADAPEQDPERGPLHRPDLGVDVLAVDAPPDGEHGQVHEPQRERPVRVHPQPHERHQPAWVAVLLHDQHEDRQEEQAEEQGPGAPGDAADEEGDGHGQQASHDRAGAPCEAPDAQGQRHGGDGDEEPDPGATGQAVGGAVEHRGQPALHHPVPPGRGERVGVGAREVARQDQPARREVRQEAVVGQRHRADGGGEQGHEGAHHRAAGQVREPGRARCRGRHRRHGLGRGLGGHAAPASSRATWRTLW